MSARLPPMSTEDVAAFNALEALDSGTLHIGTIARLEVRRENGWITATFWSLTPGLADSPLGIEGFFPSYSAAFIALVDSMDGVLANAHERALDGRPSH